MESQTPLIYEKAIIILAEIIGTEYANRNQIISLSPIVKAIRTLIPKKSVENTQYAQTRHISAMQIIQYFDSKSFEWTDEFNEEMRKTQGIDTLIEFLKQDSHETYKTQAALICAMIAENGGLNMALV